MSKAVPLSAAEWQPTACVLSAGNCGIEVQVAKRVTTRVKGDKAHPASKGYASEKAQRLADYQGNPRVVSPLRRAPDGDYEEVAWDTAIAEVAARLGRLRKAHGGASIFPCRTPIEVTDMMRLGNVSLPNGLGLAQGPGGPVTGVPPNELTGSEPRDWLAGAPWHKHVPVRLEPLDAKPSTEPDPNRRSAT